MILATTADIKQHVAIAASFQYEDLEPYIKQAVYQFTEKFVGNLDETLADAATGENAAIKNKARGILQGALANFALYLYTPIGSVMVDSAGFSTSETDQRRTLDWGHKKDLQRNFLMAGHTAMDRLLTYLEQNKAVFADWAGSDQYTESMELLVNNTATFQKYYNIYNSRQTYLALQPSLLQVEDQHIGTLLCPELITHLKTVGVSGKVLQVKTLLQKAIVAFTVAKVAREGIFTIDASGIMLKFDVLSTDKPQSPDYGKPAEFLKNTVEQQNIYGQNYLQQATDIIKANLTDFSQCASPIIEATATAGITPYNTTSTLGL